MVGAIHKLPLLQLKISILEAIQVIRRGTGIIVSLRITQLLRALGSRLHRFN